MEINNLVGKKYKGKSRYCEVYLKCFFNNNIWKIFEKNNKMTFAVMKLAHSDNNENVNVF